MEWIISANSKIYNHKKAFKDHGYIDWKQKGKYKIGDIIFIYCTIPLKKIMYKTIVETIDIPFDEITDDKEYWERVEVYEKAKGGVYSRLRLLDFVDNSLLDLEYLKENGLKAAPQSPLKIKNEQLLQYIESYFNNNDHIEISNQNTEFLHEGSLKTIKVNKYERNPIARHECLAKYGTSCSVCEMNFEEIYGDIGAGFIHVHHIKPLNEIKEDYKINPETDLIPVCPNCHSMLHRKYEGKYLRVEELKQLIKNRNKRKVKKNSVNKDL